MDSSFKWELPYEWTDDWFWEGLAFTLYFARPITDAEQEQLRRLVLAWYEVGVWGGYGPAKAGKGVLHFLSDIVVENDADEPRVEWWVDMGSAPEFALGALMHCLQTWSRETDVPLAKLVFGRHPDFSVDESS
jgi:hypothetical protein